MEEIVVQHQWAVGKNGWSEVSDQAIPMASKKSKNLYQTEPRSIKYKNNIKGESSGEKSGIWKRVKWTEMYTSVVMDLSTKAHFESGHVLFE